MSFGDMLKRFVRGPIGLAVLMAWYYCTFYSCVLVWPEWTVRESEQYWAVSLLVAAVVSGLLFVVLKKRPDFFRRLQEQESLAFVASVVAGLSSGLIFAGYMLPGMPLYLVTAGAVGAGAALPVLLLCWVGLLRRCAQEVIEFSVPAAFLVSIILYLPLVGMKNIVSVLVICLLPVASWGFARMWRCGEGRESDAPMEGGSAALVPKTTKGVRKTMVLFFVMWFSFAFFRSCVSPTYFTDRFDHYLLPFACAAILAAVLCVVTLVHARRVGLFSTYRWVIPFMCLGYAMVLVDSSSISRLAFTASFVGLVGIQMCFVLVAAKQARRCQVNVASLVLPLMTSLGLGVFCGSFSGLWVLNLVSEGVGVSYAPLLIVVLVAAVMAWGVDADVLAEEPAPTVVKDSGAQNNVLRFVPPAAAIIDNVAVGQARELARRYGLSPREREILGYLLAGRSRPFIRDELVLSLNTVNTHVRNIYAKVGVHSQQELLTLVRESQPTVAPAGEEPLRKTS